MKTIIHYLLLINQDLQNTINQLLLFIIKYIPLRQMAYDESKSPKYQKFKTDILPVILKPEKHDYLFLNEYYKWKYGKGVTPIKRRKATTVPENYVCPRCGAPHEYLYDNNGMGKEFLCKMCGQTFVNGKNTMSPLILMCPYCNHSLSAKKDRKHFVVHKCVNKKCSYYQSNYKKLPKDLPKSEMYKYKLHYIYREFNVDFFKMELNSLPNNAASLDFRKLNGHIMGLCLTYKVNLGLSLRKTAEALSDIHGISISHTMVANFARTAAVLVKPFVDNYPYERSDTFIADETYIKVRGIKGYVWFIIDALKRSIIGYRVSADRGVAHCILAMRMAFNGLTKLPEKFKFIADGYAAYPLAAQQFALNADNPLHFDITQVIGLSNNDPVSKQFRPFKQIVERLNRTFKASYRQSCGYDNFDGANFDLSLWVAYYNFLRPHYSFGRWQTLNHVHLLSTADNMPAKWQFLLLLGQNLIASLNSA